MALTTSRLGSGHATDAHGRAGVKSLRFRFLLWMGLVGFVYFFLIIRLYWLQILRGEELATAGERNFEQEKPVPHDRGIIYDRYGRIIVDNRPSLDVQVTPAFLGKADEAKATLQRVAELVGVTPEELGRVQQAIGKARGLDRFQPIVFKKDLEPQQVEAIEAERAVFLLDGVEIVEGRRRTYPYGTTAAHLLGYVNEIDKDSLEAQNKIGNPRKYKLGDAIGRAGVERTHEEELRGEDGYEKVMVDSKGRRQTGDWVNQLLGDDRFKKPTPGHNVYLTIDLELQQRTEAAFTGQAGAVVALDPRSGAILAMASMPQYDPNRVSGALAKEEKNRLDTDPLKPWLDRTIQGQYAPGSTFKVVTAIAALRHKATSPTDMVFCPGYFRMGNRVWRCHKDSGHGWVNLKDALKVSCDTYFYTMGARVGIDAIAEAGRLLGYGSRSGIPLLDEKAGIMPTEAWHNKVDAKTGGYQRGMVINTAIGQGSVVVTPLQQAMAYAAIANGGTVFKPQIVDHIETADFRVARRFLPQASRWLVDPEAPPQLDGSPLSDDGLHSVDALSSLVQEEIVGAPPSLLKPWLVDAARVLSLTPFELGEVRRGLAAVTQEPGGTGYWRRSKIVTMAGKTGTAQVVRIGRERLKVAEMDYFQRDHAWFTSYAPVDQPEIVVAVLNEHAGHGGTEAEPIATAVIDAYFELKQKRQAQATASASAAPAPARAPGPAPAPAPVQGPAPAGALPQVTAPRER